MLVLPIVIGTCGLILWTASEPLPPSQVSLQEGEVERVESFVNDPEAEPLPAPTCIDRVATEPVGRDAGPVADARQAVHLIAEAEAAFRDAVRIDENANGMGEYGLLDELAGMTDAPGQRSAGGAGLQGFQDGGIDGVLLRDGYCFRVFLPDGGGRGAGRELRTAPRSDAALREQYWCCYAWPAYYGVTGTHTLFLRSDGELLVTANGSRQYSGVDYGPAAWAAFATSSDGMMHSELARSVPAIDGQEWFPAEVVPALEFTIEIGDDRGEPIVDLEVAVVDPVHMDAHPRYRPEDLHRLAARGRIAAPCGRARTDARGAVRFSGWPVAGMAVAILGSSGRPIPAASSSIHQRELGLTIQLSAADSRCARVEVGERQAMEALERFLGSGRRKLDPPSVPADLAARSGYQFEFHRAADGFVEQHSAAGPWYCYAWPKEYGITGRRAFLASARGDIVACRNERVCYSGSRAPDACAAFRRGPHGRPVEACLDEGPASDGEFWGQVR